MMMCSARYRTGWKTEAEVQGITCEESRREMDGDEGEQEVLHIGETRKQRAK